MQRMAEGTFFNERAAIEQAFNSVWNGETPIQWENVAFTPPTGNTAEYVQFFLVRGDRRQASIGDNALFRGFGIIQVNVFVRAGAGMARIEALSDLVKTVFQRRSISGIVECFATSSYPIQEENGWVGRAIQTEYMIEEDFARPAAISNLDGGTISFVGGGTISFVGGGDIEFAEAA